MNFGSKISFADRWFLYFLLSDSISDRTLLLLFLDAVEFFAALNNTCISARTLVLLLLYKEFPTTKNISLVAFMLRDKK